MIFASAALVVAWVQDLLRRRYQLVRELGRSRRARSISRTSSSGIIRRVASRTTRIPQDAVRMLLKSWAPHRQLPDGLEFRLLLRLSRMGPRRSHRSTAHRRCRARDSRTSHCDAIASRGLDQPAHGCACAARAVNWGRPIRVCIRQSQPMTSRGQRRSIPPGSRPGRAIARVSRERGDEAIPPTPPRRYEVHRLGASAPPSRCNASPRWPAPA